MLQILNLNNMPKTNKNNYQKDLIFQVINLSQHSLIQVQQNSKLIKKSVLNPTKILIKCKVYKSIILLV